MNTRIQKNEKGFTMIELIVVVAILAIIGAILVPMFSQMSLKARLTTDISTIKTFQRQIDAYKTEHSEYPGSFATNDSTKAVDATVGGKLVTEKYIDQKDMKKVGSSGYTIKLQTGGDVRTSNGSCYLNIPSGTTTATNFKAIIDSWDSKDGNYGWAYVK